MTFILAWYTFDIIIYFIVKNITMMLTEDILHPEEFNEYEKA